MVMLIGAPTRRLSWLRFVPVQNQNRGWVCQSCRSRGKFTITTTTTGRKPFSSSSSILQEATVKEKPYYVTTPIFYVNASPHIGHLYSMLIADVLKRWEALKGREAILCTGTDEHGMKVQQAAERQDVAPKVLCDANSETFRDLARRGHIANDHFVRTTDADHRAAVEHFWARLRERGFLYEKARAGWYCVSDEAFVPAALVERRQDPATGRLLAASAESGAAVEWVEERNYHFRLTALKDRLLEFYAENPEWVTPATRMAEVVDWVKNRLEDLSVSRPVGRLTWGIPVPGDPGQTIYVWIDALVNYITKAGYPNWTPGAEHAGGWPADVHVIGKDIVRFHCVYWPALLMALDLPLPRRVLSHAHWLINARKMAKSTGNVVNPFFALDRWGVDPLRYFLIYSGGIAHDADYGNAFVVKRYQKGLQSGLGNLMSRIARPKTWNVRMSVVAAAEGGWDARSGNISSGSSSSSSSSEMASLEGGLIDDIIKTQIEHLTTVVHRADAHMVELNPGAALREIMKFVFDTNRYVSEAAPWDLAKGPNADALKHVIYTAAESLRITGILLQPFMPEKAAEILDRLGVAPEKRSLADATLGADADYGVPVTDTRKPLFPPLDVED